MTASVPVPDPSPATVSPAPVAARRSVGDWLYRYSVLWALLLEILVFSLLEPQSFFTILNLQSILGSQGILLIVALGLTIPLAVNEFDLSIGSVLVFSQVILGTLTVSHGWPLVLAVLVSLGLCLIIGLINAILIVKVNVGAFIATLGMGTLLLGLTTKLTDSQPIPNIPSGLVHIAATKVLGVQMVFWYGLAATVGLWYVLSKTPYGRWLYFVGANRDMARLNGVPVDLVRGSAIVASALFAGIGGILYAGVFGTADPTISDEFLLPAFAAAFLGATAVTPGRFNAWGTIISVYLVITGIVGLTLVTGQVGWISDVFNGTVLLVAVGAQPIVAARRAKALRKNQPIT